MKISIIIPAHNEEKRIGTTLEHYCTFFEDLKKQHVLDFEIVVVLNGCTDNTLGVVQNAQHKCDAIQIIDLIQAGKGLAIIKGFNDALTRDNDLISFVDADMATSPQAFYDLIDNLEDYDGIIGSRYMYGARVIPPRPLIKRLGSLLVFESLVWLLFRLSYKDLQCGAKIFRRHVIEVIIPHLTITQWVLDIELLYLCKKYGFTIKEFPTIWYDKSGSKLSMLKSGLRMLSSVIALRLRHSPFRGIFKLHRK